MVSPLRGNKRRLRGGYTYSRRRDETSSWGAHLGVSGFSRPRRDLRETVSSCLGGLYSGCFCLSSTSNSTPWEANFVWSFAPSSRNDCAPVNGRVYGGSLDIEHKKNPKGVGAKAPSLLT